MKLFAAFVLVALAGVAVGCSDESPFCDGASQGRCTSPEFQTRCPVLCNNCPAASSVVKCKDRVKWCSTKPRFYCNKFSWFSRRCNRYCGHCPCKDLSNKCSSLPIAKCASPAVRAKCPQHCHACCKNVFGHPIICPRR